MILGRGTAQTYEAITAEFHLFLENSEHRESLRTLKEVRRLPAFFARHINKPLAEWSDEDIIALYEGKSKSVGIRYNIFVSFPLLWLLTICGKPLEEITRSDFDQFRDEYQQRYRQEIFQIRILKKCWSTASVMQRFSRKRW